jgi:nucleoid-associated protein YgaU
MKMKLPKMFSGKPKKKLRAAAVRKPLRIAATADYEEMAEPNMKLSRALLIVLVLHIVAVSGIIAFNAIKTRQNTTTSAMVSSPAASGRARPEPAPSAALAGKEPLSRQAEAKPARSASKPPLKDERKGEHGRTTTVVDSGKVYVVTKRDNPVNIAKKLKVSYDDLLAINHIDDPHKLQIGQKLIVPKPPKAKKVEE